MTHPTIVKDYEHNLDNLWIVYEYIDGSDLATLLAERGPCDFRWSAKIIMTLAEALQHAHVKAFLHRDIKPDNILLNKKEDPYLTDFGLASIEGLIAAQNDTKFGITLGNYRYTDHITP